MRRPVLSSPKQSLVALDERTCRLICPISGAMVGVCLTAVGILQVGVKVGHSNSIADDLISIDAILFLIATLCSYFALRVSSPRRLHRMERVADIAFIAAMLLMTAVIVVITYVVSH